MPREGQLLTPEEWVEKFLEATPEKRLEAAQRVLHNTEAANKCWLEDHRSAIGASYRKGWEDALRELQAAKDKETD